MRDFQVFVRDDRYSVPTLHIIHATTTEQACEMAERLVSESRHHLGAEVFDAGRRIRTLDAGPVSPDPTSP